jgi:hypothetical protein
MFSRTLFSRTPFSKTNCTILHVLISIRSETVVEDRMYGKDTLFIQSTIIVWERDSHYNKDSLTVTYPILAVIKHRSNYQDNIGIRAPPIVTVKDNQVYNEKESLVDIIVQTIALTRKDILFIDIYLNIIVEEQQSYYENRIIENIVSLNTTDRFILNESNTIANIITSNIIEHKSKYIEELTMDCPVIIHNEDIEKYQENISITQSISYLAIDIQDGNYTCFISLPVEQTIEHKQFTQDLLDIVTILHVSLHVIWYGDLYVYFCLIATKHEEFNLRGKRTTCI